MTGMFNQIMFNVQRGYYRYIGAGSSREVFDFGKWICNQSGKK